MSMMWETGLPMTVTIIQCAPLMSMICPLMSGLCRFDRSSVYALESALAWAVLQDNDIIEDTKATSKCYVLQSVCVCVCVCV